VIIPGKRLKASRVSQTVTRYKETPKCELKVLLGTNLK